MDEVATFERDRSHLRAVAYRMLGSHAESEDAVQETWLRFARTDTRDVQNVRAWLTTVISRICLDMLRARAARREDPLDVRVPDPIVTPVNGEHGAGDPESAAELADSVGLALLVVLDTLAPAERLAFVLHDVFAMPFDEIALIVERSPDAAKQLASRARRRLREAPPAAASGAARTRAALDAFLAAAREGDFAGLVSLLDPDVVLRADAGDGPLGPSQFVRGAVQVATQARRFAELASHARPVLVNGSPGAIVVMDGRVISLASIVVTDGRIVEIDILADPVRLAALDIEL